MPIYLYLQVSDIDTYSLSSNIPGVSIISWPLNCCPSMFNFQNKLSPFFCHLWLATCVLPATDLHGKVSAWLVSRVTGLGDGLYLPLYVTKLTDFSTLIYCFLCCNLHLRVITGDISYEISSRTTTKSHNPPYSLSKFWWYHKINKISVKIIDS